MGGKESNESPGKIRWLYYRVLRGKRTILLTVVVLQCRYLSGEGQALLGNSSSQSEESRTNELYPEGTCSSPLQISKHSCLELDL